MNKLLQLQLQEHFGGADKVPENFRELLTVISGSYDNFEKDRKMIECAIELNSNEMIELNSDLKKEKEELKKAHAELQQALGNITKIMDSSLDVICAVDAKGNFIKVSAASEAVWGYKPEELIGKPLINFVYHKDNEKTQATAGHVMAGNNIGHFENRYIRKDGSLVPIEWSARWDENDKIRYGVARDVTEKKRLEKAFEIERQRFYDLFIKAPTCVGILKGPDHIYEMANPLYLELLGKKDIIGKSVKEIRPEIVEQGIIEILDNVYKTGITFSVNEMLVKFDTVGNGEMTDKYANLVYQAYRNTEGIIEGIFFFAIDVTEQVVSRKKIEESEKGYRQIVETAQEGIWMIDENNVTTFVNKKMAEILEYSIEEMMGKKNYCFMDDEWKEKASGDIINRKLGKSENHDFKYLSKNGKIVWTNLSTNPVFDDAGIYKGALAMVTDITENKKAAEALANNELRFRTLTSSAPVGIFQTNQEGKTIYVNETLLSYTGMEMSEALGEGWVEAVHPDDRERMLGDWQHKAKKGLKSSSEYRFINKNGKIRWVSGEAIPMFTDTGEITGHIGTLTDITERKKTESLIKESELRYRSLIEQASDAICITDASLKFIDINPYALGMFGYTLEEALQLSLPDILFKEDLAANPIKLNEIKLGEATRNERRLKRKDGTAVDMAVSTKLMENGSLIMFGHDITERKKAGEEIKKSELRYRSLIEQATDAICITDISMKFIDINPAGCLMSGYSREEILQLSLPDILFKEDLITNPFKIGEMAPGKTIWNERRLKRKDGTGIEMEISTKMLEDGRFIIFGHDISERKKAESVLKENEGQLSIVAQIAKLGYWEFDVTKNLFKFNDHFYSIFKTTAEEVGGYTISSERYLSLFVHPDDYLIVANVAANAIKSPDPYYNEQIEHRIIYADGGIGYMAVRFFTVKNDRGRTIKTYGAIQDITEKKNAEAVLRKSERQLSIATQIAKLGYWELDIVNNLFTFTDQFYTIFKTTAEKAGGYTMTPQRYTELFVHPDDRSIVAEEVAKAIHSADPLMSYQLEHRIIYATGETGYISVHFYIVKDAEGRTIKTFGVNQDITDRKKGEETLLKSEANLEVKNKQLEQKNKELEQFAYVASHDMQEPLRTTSSFVELLQKQYSGRLDEKADKYLTFIAQSSDRMKVLIKDLLDYSRIGKKTELAEVDCNIILTEVLADLGKAITETNAEIKAETLPVISGYPTEIKQLFQNLIINAIKFRKQNTTPDITICVQKKDSYWEFAVKDNGIGIDEQHKDRIFVIFQRLHTRNNYEGSGIGLAHCKKIVELHGGKIWIDSKPGKGSTFRFTIHQSNN